jgi:predicted ATPase with chaperone activity
MQTCTCCGVPIVTPELLPWEKIAGQYHVKRAIEVACAGGHTLTLHTPNGLGVDALSLRQWALGHDAGAVVIVRSCPCGYYGTFDNKECTCSEELITTYRANDPAWAQVVNCDMHIEMVKPKYQDVVAVATGKLQKAGAIAVDRIVCAQQYKKQYAINPTLDDTSYMLLGSATRLLELSTIQVQRVLAVTMTITALAGETKIHCAHLAEALQYRMRQGV